MKAVVMAGGFGTRIQPLTHSRPKPMLPIVNRPMMEHTMMMLKDLGISEFIVLLYFKPEIIQNYFGDGSAFGIKITYVVPDDDYGTAGAVKLASEYIGDENFIVISGDLVTDFDFQKIFDFHAQKGAKLSIGLTSVENPLQFGVVIANKENVIEKFLEKPSWGEVFSDTINTGIYIIEPEILDFIPRGENFDFAKNLFPSLMSKSIPLMGCNLEGYWRDVGNPESYREVYDDILNGRVGFKFGGFVKHYPDGVLYSEEAYEFDHSIKIVGNVVLGKNVKIKDGTKLSNVVIGDNVSIGAACNIANTVIWSDVKIKKNVKLDNSVICNDNVIEKNVTAKAGVILSEGCEVGELASFEQDVTIWPDKKIEPASIISHNIVWGSRYKNSIFQNGTVSGKSNVELSCEMATKLAEAFAAQLPVGSKVVVGRDYNKSSRMLKRAFLGGLLSAGVNVLDLKNTPPAVLRYTIANSGKIAGGAHFKQSIFNPTESEITLFNDEAIRIDSNSAKNIEKAFFTEKFRRVDFSRIGEIKESMHHHECHNYKSAVESRIDQNIIKCSAFKVAVDLMHGSTADIFPNILNDIGVENIILNAYHDEHKLSNFTALKKRSEENISKIVSTLDYNMGVMIYPNAQSISLVTDDGEVLDMVKGLLAVLHLLDMYSSKTKKKVFLPTWAPDIISFKNLEIQRGKYANFKAAQLREYALIATVDGNFAFSDFGVYRDAMFASLRIMEMLSCSHLKLSEISKMIAHFYYKQAKIACTQSLKGKMMRKFLEDAKGKRSSSEDGVKIWENDTDWILMIPDQYDDHLNLYIQASNEASGEALLESYTQKIKNYAGEKE
ncbi:MAG: sugar phosphate nucleotidyltransferase [Sulfurimonas sp.]|uniref:sugar phosphate nucleotidyltransferase n=1 Tax=Sulfurimonas sp. TaxID=2022749 RepID=UPI00260737B4|nr:sugar phosphate nucleotidyltransferase [Sulfurimonas sp.]MDD2652258.1 sugar phosphate nucleotidyltransferase [Sulfurimonas sp.]MDD3451573.1 sugar phosphate nucleotidyltransferase [Sulfurimonas sp.]